MRADENPLDSEAKTALMSALNFLGDLGDLSVLRPSSIASRTGDCKRADPSRGDLQALLAERGERGDRTPVRTVERIGEYACGLPRLTALALCTDRLEGRLIQVVSASEAGRCLSGRGAGLLLFLRSRAASKDPDLDSGVSKRGSASTSLRRSSAARCGSGRVACSFGPMSSMGSGLVAALSTLVPACMPILASSL